MSPKAAPSFHIRFEAKAQHEALVREAKAAKRSLNAHLIYLLETHPERKRK